MQDFRSIAELSGRIFGGAVIDWTGGADNRSLKAYPPAMAPPPQLKCPRCESLNTKFCYYNNYNLSQPRHFCKSCRRYWTRGGVLRNVPVGGGCRKPKRSSSSKSSSDSSSTDKDRRHKNSGSRSSSDSSALTPATADCPADSAILFKSPSSNPNPPNSSNPSFHQTVHDELLPFDAPPAEIFLDPTHNQSILKFNFIDQDRPHRNLDEIHGQEFIYQKAPGEPPPVRDPSGAIDWPSGLDSSIYDLAGAGDPAAYWNHAHWNDGDPSLYLP